LKNFRQINETERKIIDLALNALTPNLRAHNYDIYSKFYISIEENNRGPNFPQVYLLPKENIATLKKLKNIDNIKSAGLYFGFIMKGNFHLSIEGTAYLLSSNLIPKEKIIIINNDAEKSTLYGNNISKGMIETIPESFYRKDLLLVLNPANELIALVQSKVDYIQYSDLNSDDVVAVNLVDKGYYLRRER